MKERVDFEKLLYTDENEIAILINDIEFCVDRIVMFPGFRPHQLERTVKLCMRHCQNIDFRYKLLEKSKNCPVLIYLLYKRGVFVFEEIEPFLKNIYTLVFCFYFRKEIADFDSFIRNKVKPNGIESFIMNPSEIDQMIEYGFLPSSIEYSLKYDDIDSLREIGNINQNGAIWSPFEWSFRPDHLDLLSFSGFFGSVKCFKHLIMNGLEINENVFSMVACSGCFDLFHFCQSSRLPSMDSVCKASEYCHLALLSFMIECGSDINGKDNRDKNLFLEILPFIQLLRKVIFVLLNIL